MPIGFNLFSFDLFEAFRRDRRVMVEGEIAETAQRSTVAAVEDVARARQQSADQAFWRVGYFPFL